MQHTHTHAQTHTNTHTYTHTTAAEKRAKELEEELARTKKAADEAKKKAEKEANKKEEEAEARAKEKAAADAKVVILANISRFVCVLSKSTVWVWGMEIIEVETILKFFPVSLTKMETDLLDRKWQFPFPGRTLWEN